MQAIILAAGMGKRLGTLTKNNTKCMIEVNGEKLIDRTLNQLLKYNLEKIILVVGYEADNLITYIQQTYPNVKNIEFIRNEIYDKTNNIYSLGLAKEELIKDDTLLLESDLIYDDTLLDRLINNPYPNLALVAKYETWMDGTMVHINEDNYILDFVNKKNFNYEDIDSYYKTVNIYKFSKEFSEQQYVPFLMAYCHAMGYNEYYEQVLRVLTSLDRTNLKALPIGDSKWYEIDDVQDLDIAETIFSKGKEKLNKYYSRYGGYWRFPKVLDFCYLVNPFFPPQKMKDELQSNFNQLLTEYPSGMKVNSLLAGKYFGINSNLICVGNGAAELIKCIIENHTIGKLGVIYPTFEEYPNRIQEDRIISFKPNNQSYSYSVKDLIDYFTNKNVDTLLLINPDNPSGNFIPKEELINLIQWGKEHNIRLIVDESFVDFSKGSTQNSIIREDILIPNPHLIVVKSISKSYGVPGLRLGVIASGDIELIKQIKQEVSIWNINSFGEYYLQIFGKYEKDYNVACQLFIQERENFYQELQNISWLRVIPSQANYFLCEVVQGFTSTQICQRLLDEYNILLKDCSNKKGFDGKNYIRIAVRSNADNRSLIQALKELTKGN